MEEEPLYEVKVVVDGHYRVIIDGISSEKANVLASNLHEIGIRNILVEKYYSE